MTTIRISSISVNGYVVCVPWRAHGAIAGNGFYGEVWGTSYQDHKVWQQCLPFLQKGKWCMVIFVSTEGISICIFWKYCADLTVLLTYSNLGFPKPWFYSFGL